LNFNLLILNLAVVRLSKLKPWRPAPSPSRKCPSTYKAPRIEFTLKTEKS